MSGEILLVLTLVMPREMPDKHYKLHMDSIDQCVAEVKAYVDNGVTEAMAKIGVIGVAGACFTDKKKEEGDL